MTLTINGESRTFNDMATLSDLIDSLALKGDRVAVELNRNIVSRGEWASTPLSDGDKLEIVHFVGGGTSRRPVASRWRLGRLQNAAF